MDKYTFSKNRVRKKYHTKLSFHLVKSLNTFTPHFDLDSSNQLWQNQAELILDALSNLGLLVFQLILLLWVRLQVLDRAMISSDVGTRMKANVAPLSSQMEQLNKSIKKVGNWDDKLWSEPNSPSELPFSANISAGVRTRPFWNRHSHTEKTNDHPRVPHHIAITVCSPQRELKSIQKTRWIKWQKLEQICWELCPPVRLSINSCLHNLHTSKKRMI